MTQKEVPVSITIEYPDHDQADVKVDPEEVTIYYNRNGESGDPELARKVRWEVDGVHEGDRVVIRPKKALDGWKKRIFVPPAGKKHFETMSEETSTVCSPPDFSNVPEQVRIQWKHEAIRIEWKYDAVILRGDREIGSHDPAILIIEDP